MPQAPAGGAYNAAPEPRAGCKGAYFSSEEMEGRKGGTPGKAGEEGRGGDLLLMRGEGRENVGRVSRPD